jgi:hypothetical protein
MTFSTEICRLAQNLARNCNYAVFPCSEQKMPLRPKREGGDGFKDATKDPDKIAWLWRHWPGPLIGIATGATSNIIVLDFDVKHDTARAWVQTHGPPPAANPSAAHSVGRRERVPAVQDWHPLHCRQV